MKKIGGDAIVKGLKTILLFVLVLVALPLIGNFSGTVDPAHATVTVETARIQYNCNGVTTAYTYPFEILEDDDLLAIKASSSGVETTLVLNTDYTVAGAGSTTGGTVTLTAASKCASGYTLTLLRNIELTQETDYVDGEAFSAESIENAFDKMALIQQQQAERIDRSLKLKKSSTLTDIDVPSGAGKVIGWNSAGTGFATYSPTSVSTTDFDNFSNYSGFNAAISAIGATEQTIVCNTAQTVSADVTVPENVHIVALRGCSIDTTGYTLTINGDFQAGLYQVFSGTGTVAGLKEARPDWWGFSASETAANNLTYLTYALAASPNIIISKGTYSLDGPVMVPSNVNIYVANGAIISKPTDGDNEGWWQFVDVENIKIEAYGAEWKYATKPTADEQRHIFQILGGSKITILGAKANDSGGDGFYVGPGTLNAYSANITLRDVSADNNRRNNMSITSVDGLLVENSSFTDADGTSPECGVDIKPNNATDLIKNVVFRKCNFSLNDSAGLNMNFTYFDTTSEPISILIDSCTTYQNKYFGFTVINIDDSVPGHIIFRDNVSEEEGLNAIRLLGKSATGAFVDVIRHTAINCDTAKDFNAANSFGAPFYVRDSTNVATRTTVGGVRFKNCVIFDDQANIRYGFSTKAYFDTITDIFFDDNKITGNSSVDYNIDQASTNTKVFMHPPERYHMAASANVSTAMLGSIIDNTGAGGQVKASLQTPKAGIVYKFVVTVAQNFWIAPLVAGTIVGTGGGCAGLQSNTIGDLLTLEGQADGTWLVIEKLGTWAEI